MRMDSAGHESNRCRVNVNDVGLVGRISSTHDGHKAKPSI